uniref:WGS project CAEQ00000000 data, annotated contig 2436 n=1 Tax=Trypanosoma congolense (strain IL3000) TaxID=1068625 RepID=F9WE42_TRYCI|nr:unnamed protein product [Trypanosoma congolense IL3000]
MTSHEVPSGGEQLFGGDAMGSERLRWSPRLVSVCDAVVDSCYMSPATTIGSPSVPLLSPSDLLTQCDSRDGSKQAECSSTQHGKFCTATAVTEVIANSPGSQVTIVIGNPPNTFTAAVGDAANINYVPPAGASPTAARSPCDSDASLDRRMNTTAPTDDSQLLNPPSPFFRHHGAMDGASDSHFHGTFPCFRWRAGSGDRGEGDGDSDCMEDDASDHLLWSAVGDMCHAFGQRELVSAEVRESAPQLPEHQQQLHRCHSGRSQKERQGLESPEDAIRSNLFVSGLRHNVTDVGLHDLFAPFGEIESAKVMLDIHTGRSRGIAFVKFAKVSDAQKAAEALNSTAFNGENITVRVAKPNAAYRPGEPTNKTFVRNVPLSVKKEDLVAHFGSYGQVVEVSIHGDTAQCSTSKKRNVVFITYTTKEAAAWAAQQTHTTMPFPDCDGVPLLAKVAEDSAHRIERLARRGSGKQGSTSNKAVSSSSTSLHTANQLPPPPPVPHQTHLQQQSLLQIQLQQQLQQQQQQLFIQQQQQQQQRSYVNGALAGKFPQPFGAYGGMPGFVVQPSNFYNADPYACDGLAGQQGLYTAPLYPMPTSPAPSTGGTPFVILGPEHSPQLAMMCRPPPAPQPQPTVMYYLPGAQMQVPMRMQMPVAAERLQQVTAGAPMRVG